MIILVRDYDHLQELIKMGCTKFRWRRNKNTHIFNIDVILPLNLDRWYHAMMGFTSEGLECHVTGHELMGMEYAKSKSKTRERKVHIDRRE